MSKKETIIEMLGDIDKLMPGQSVDCVIIGFDKEGLKILILKWKDPGLWALPGGFVLKTEDLDKAAVHVLKLRTGIQVPFLEQFKTFGNINRRDNLTVKNNLSSIEIPKHINTWLEQRFISTGYVSLVDMEKCDPKPDFASESIAWCSLEELPSLIYDHQTIVQEAISYIRNQINYLPVGITLLPEKFTMKELQNLYESILEKKLDRGNFQRKMLKLGIFNRLEKQLEGGSHKAPYLYSFDKEKYEKLLEKGFGFNS